jgi:hypothetical protein
MRVDTVYVKIDFTNNGNYLDGIEHRMTFAGVFAWNPLETYNPPVWQNTYVHKCSGGCVLYYQWSPAAGNADIDLSNYNAFGGPGHGFKDAMFFVDCESCGEIGGVIFEEGRYNFPRDVMTVNGEFASGGEGHYPYP